MIVSVSLYHVLLSVYCRFTKTNSSFHVAKMGILLVSAVNVNNR